MRRAKTLSSRSERIRRLLIKARLLKSRLEAYGALFDELDLITNELVSLKFKQSALAELKDQFETRNVAFKTTSIRRYVLEFFK